MARRISEALAEAAPWLASGALVDAQRAALARVEARIALTASWLNQQPGGDVDAKGNVRAAAAHLSKLERLAADLRHGTLRLAASAMDAGEKWDRAQRRDEILRESLAAGQARVAAMEAASPTTTTTETDSDDTADDEHDDTNTKEDHPE